MYIVITSYDDNSAEILDLGNYSIRKFTESELIKFSDNRNVLGLSVSNNKINYINAYSIKQFCTEDEATEYCRECGIGFNNKIYALDYWWIFERNNIVIHVDYYVMHYTEVEQTYVAEKGYTCYIEHAKSFRKSEAYKKAGAMNQAHAKKYGVKKSNHWSVYRVENK